MKFPTRESKLSEAAFIQSQQVMPGGVSSPVRACKSVSTHPRFIASGSGSHIRDIDGNDYIDYVCSWGPLILGHAHPTVIQSIQSAATRGTSFGAPTLAETQMAKLIIERIPSIECVRMVNSGTEATMSVLRLARGYTKRNKIVKFEGCYHGHVDALLIKAGSGVATLGLPDSPGVPQTVANETITLPYNDLHAVRSAFAQYGEDIAAVVVEPIAGNMGVVLPNEGFLQGLRSITKQFGSLLIFDEVMTGFRVHMHSAQGLYQVTPDLTCLGKVIGGGLPVGAYGGRKDIMEMIAPSGSIYQAGTLSGNPLAMAAGFTTLELIGESGVYEQLELKSARLAQGFLDNASDIGVALIVNRVGSMVCPFFTNQPVFDYTSAKRADAGKFAAYYNYMLDLGVYLPPSQYEGMFVSLAHSDEDISYTIEMHREALIRLKQVE
jgi:glutamate-1-semialdehyde 2,1-aminomutase